MSRHRSSTAPPEIHDLLVVNDLDRTLFDTRRFTTTILRVASTVFGIEEEEIEKMIDARRQLRQTTQIHDLLFIKAGGRKKAKSLLESMYQQIVDTATPDSVLYPDAAHYLDRLNDTDGVDHMTMTYGPVQQQEAKLCVAGLAGRPYLITDTPVKGPIMQSWKKHRGKGLINPRVSQNSPGLSNEFRHTILVDDKADAFAQIVGGFVVQRPTEYPESNSELWLPPGTTFVRDLLAVEAALWPIDDYMMGEPVGIYWRS